MRTLLYVIDVSYLEEFVEVAWKLHLGYVLSVLEYACVHLCRDRMPPFSSGVSYIHSFVAASLMIHGQVPRLVDTDFLPWS